MQWRGGGGSYCFLPILQKEKALAGATRRLVDSLPILHQQTFGTIDPKLFFDC
jgi:hypothetical protein